MANLEILLKRKERRWRRELILFVEALSLHLSAGLDLGFSWPETLASLACEISPELRAWLDPEEESVGRLLNRLAGDYPFSEHRLWFAALRDLHGSGAALGQAVSAMAAFLRREQEAALETHARELPTKINVLLLLFFLPPTFLLLFLPLVWEILHAFP